MIQSPARAGHIGPLWCLHLVVAIYARPRNKATSAATAARAGLEMSMKFNTRFTNVWTGEWLPPVPSPGASLQALKQPGAGTEATS